MDAQSFWPSNVMPCIEWSGIEWSRSTSAATRPWGEHSGRRRTCIGSPIASPVPETSTTDLGVFRVVERREGDVEAVEAVSHLGTGRSARGKPATAMVSSLPL